MSEERVSLPQVAKAAGVQYRTMQVWAEKGLLGRVRFRGAGHPVSLTLEQQALAIQLGQLRRAGLEFGALKKLAREIRKGSADCPLCGIGVIDQALPIGERS